MLPKVNCSICDKVILAANQKLHFKIVHENSNEKKKKKLNEDSIMKDDDDQEENTTPNADKLEENNSSETKKLKILNSILKKELKEAKDEIVALKQENEVLTAEYGRLQDLSEELIAENISLKNGQQSFDADDQSKSGGNENISVTNDVIVKSEKDVKVEVHNGRKKNQHVMMVQGEQNYKCHLCDRTYTLSGSLNRHFRKSHPNYKKLKSENSIHSNQTSEKKSKTVKRMNSKIHSMLMNLTPISLTPKKLKVDKSLLKVDKLFNCDECGKGFRNIHQTNRHKNSVHGGIKNHHCPFCDLRYSRSDALKLHISKKHEKQRKKTHKCKLCDKAFVQPCSLSRHLKKSHKKSEKLIEEIEKTSKSNQIISDQKSIVSSNQEALLLSDDDDDGKGLQDNKIFKCDACEKSFARNSKLIRHINGVHRGIKNYQCPVCDKKFGQYSNLKQHIIKRHNVQKIKKNHSAKNGSLESDGTSQNRLKNDDDSKKYKCELCIKYFSQRGHLNRHFKKEHNNEKMQAKNDIHSSDEKIEKQVRKTHKCDSCGKPFSGIHELRRHIKSVHDGVKDHICKLCNKFFVRSDVLKTHVKNIHGEENSAKGEKKFKCKSCAKDFKRMFSLKRHIATIHSN